MEKLKFINKGLDKYNNLSSPVKASIWFAICNVIQKGIALISTPIFTRLLTTKEYGIYSVYQSWYSVVYLFLTLNLAAGVYNNGMIKWSDDRKRYSSSSLGLSTTIWAVFLVIFTLSQNVWVNVFSLPKALIIAMFIDALMTIAISYWSSRERFDFKYRKVVVVSILMGLVSPILGIVSVYLSEYKVVARVYSHVLVNIVVGLFFYIKIMREGKTFFVKKYWKFALGFNLPLIPHYLSQIVLNQADRIMIANIDGEDKAAIYSIAYTISMMFNIVIGAINSSFVPYTYKFLKENRYGDIKRTVNFILLGVTICTEVVILFGPEIIKIFATADYYEARWVIPPVAEAIIFSFLYGLFCNIEFYYEETRFAMAASVVAACANLLLNYIFINIFGYLAAAYTTLACYILLALIHYLMYRRLCKKNNVCEEIYNIKYIVGISIVSVVIMFGFVLIYDLTIVRYFIIAFIIIFIFIKRDNIFSIYKGLKK